MGFEDGKSLQGVKMYKPYHNLELGRQSYKLPSNLVPSMHEKVLVQKETAYSKSVHGK